MTKVTLATDGNIYSVSAYGHADGSKEACAAISQMMASLYVYVLNSKKVDDCGALMEDGNCIVTFAGDTEARAIFEFIGLGFMNMSAFFPDYISVKGENLLNGCYK